MPKLGGAWKVIGILLTMVGILFMIARYGAPFLGGALLIGGFVLYIIGQFQS